MSSPKSRVSAKHPARPHLRRLRLRARREQARLSLLFLPLVIVAVSITVAVVLADAEKRHPLAYMGVFTFTRMWRSPC